MQKHWPYEQIKVQTNTRTNKQTNERTNRKVKTINPTYFVHRDIKKIWVLVIIKTAFQISSALLGTSNICKKQIHDVGMKVYLHTYNNEKRERDRFIKKKKKKILGFEPATFRVIAEPSPDWAMGDVSVPPEN